MKMYMKTVEAQGYSKEKAFETTNLDVEFEMFKNATLAWKKAGSPVNSKDLNRFMSEYMKKNKSIAAYLVVEPASDDTRLRPYSVINETTKGKRKATTTYQIKQAELNVKYQTVIKPLSEIRGIRKTTDIEKEYLKGKYCSFPQLKTLVQDILDGCDN